MPASRPGNVNDIFEPTVRRLAMLAAAVGTVVLGASKQFLLAAVLVAGALVMWLYWRAEQKRPRCSHCNQLLTHRSSIV